MMKRILAMLLVMGMTIALTACGGQEETGQKGSSESEEKMIVVGTDGSTSGYSVLKDDGELEGFEIDVWNEIGERTGYEIQFEQMPFSSLFGLLDDGRIDTVANAIAPTDERKEIYDFSDSYIYEEQILLSAPDKSVSSLKDLDGMSVGIVAGSVDEEVIDILEEQEGITMERVNFDDTAINDVVMGKVDCCVQATGIGMAAIERLGDDKIKILTGLGQYSESAYPFAKTDKGEELRELTNATLSEMREDGTLAEISNNWFDVDLTQIPE